MTFTKTLIISLLLTITMVAPTVSMAYNGSAAVHGEVVPTGADNQNTTNAIDKIFKIEKDASGKTINKQLENLSKQVGSKQEFTFADVFASIIKILSGLAVVMTFVGAIVAGVLFVFSEGEESRTTKAKTILLYVAIGDLIIAASYAIVRGITLIKPLS